MPDRRHCCCPTGCCPESACGRCQGQFPATWTFTPAGFVGPCAPLFNVPTTVAWNPNAYSPSLGSPNYLGPLVHCAALPAGQQDSYWWLDCATTGTDPSGSDDSRWVWGLSLVSCFTPGVIDVASDTPCFEWAVLPHPSDTLGWNCSAANTLSTTGSTCNPWGWTASPGSITVNPAGGLASPQLPSSIEPNTLHATIRRSAAGNGDAAALYGSWALTRWDGTNVNETNQHWQSAAAIAFRSCTASGHTGAQSVTVIFECAAGPVYAASLVVTAPDGTQTPFPGTLHTFSTCYPLDIVFTIPLGTFATGCGSTDTVDVEITV